MFPEIALSLLDMLTRPEPLMRREHQGNARWLEDGVEITTGRGAEEPDDPGSKRD